MARILRCCGRAPKPRRSGAEREGEAFASRPERFWSPSFRWGGRSVSTQRCPPAFALPGPWNSLGAQRQLFGELALNWAPMFVCCPFGFFTGSVVQEEAGVGPGGRVGPLSPGAPVLTSATRGRRVARCFGCRSITWLKWNLAPSQAETPDFKICRRPLILEAPSREVLHVLELTIRRRKETTLSTDLKT